MPRWIKIYIVPGAVFQSIMVGGGYGTGRELVEYFVQFGIGGAFKGLLCATLLFSTLMAITFEFGRVFNAFDYRSFLSRLIGPLWAAFEVSYLFGVVLVLAILAAASAAIIETSLGLPGAAGGGLMLVLIVALNFYGRNVITAFFSAWSLVLYLVFGAYLIAILLTRTDGVASGLQAATTAPDWPLAAFKYVGYNIGAGIIALFAIRDMRSRREAVGSGLIAGLIAMAPAAMFTVAFAAGYPAIVEQEVPNYYMLELLGMPWITTLFLIVLVGTFVETGAGMIQGLNERLDGWLIERHGQPASRRVHGATALILLLLSTGMSTFGVIALVATGYGILAWGGMVLYVIPLLTVGVWRLWRHG